MIVKATQRDNKYPRLCQAVLALVMSFAFIVAILVPHSASANLTQESATVAWAQPADVLGGAPDEAADLGLVQHASCSCGVIVGVDQTGPLMTVRPSLFNEFLPPADAPSRPRRTAVPFKPPRV